MDRIKHIQEMLKEDPKDPFLHYALALEIEKNNQPTEAIVLLEKLVIEFPDYLPTYYKLGKLYEQVSNPKNAIQYYKAGIKLAKIQNETKTLGELNEALLQLED